MRGENALGDWLGAWGEDDGDESEGAEEQQDDEQGGDAANAGVSADIDDRDHAPRKHHQCNHP